MRNLQFGNGRKEKADTHVNLAVKQNNSAHSGTSKTNPSSNTSSTVKLKGGTGALLQASIGTSDKGYIFAVDSTGTAYPIANANKETLSNGLDTPKTTCKPFPAHG